MPTVTQSDNTSNTLTATKLDSDEFVPLVSIEVDAVKDATKNTFFIDNDIVSDVMYKSSSTKKEETTLSDHIDDDKRTFTTQQITTSKNKLELTFKITKGNKDSEDDDGIISVFLFKELNDGTTREIDGVKITSNAKFETKYEKAYTLQLELDPKESTEFYIDFFANDDKDDDVKYDPFNGFFGKYGTFVDDKTGKLINIHCGRFKIEFNVPLKLKPVFYAVSLMTETDYRSNNLNYFRRIVEVKNSPFGHIELGNYLAKKSEKVKNENDEFDGEEIKFLSIFSHGYENNIFGDSSDTINKSEIEAMFSSDFIHFSKDAIIFLGACNSGTGKSNSFAQKLAEVTGATVIGMVDDGVAVVSESKAGTSSPKMIYGPKYGNKYNGKFYKFKKGLIPTVVSKEYDIIKLVDKLNK